MDIKAVAERWLDDPDISLTLGGSMVACEEMQADLRRYVSALEARVASAEGALRPVTEASLDMSGTALVFGPGYGAINARAAARAHFQSQGGDHGRD